MNVTDFSFQTKINRQNNPLLPKSIRGLIIGRSNRGKTVLLLNLLLKENWLDYNNLLVFGNSLHQIEYMTIKEGFNKKLEKKQILNIFENQNFIHNISPLNIIQDYNGRQNGNINAHFYENNELIPDPKTLNPKLKNLLILDDCYLGSQSKAKAYYSRCRHNNCDVLYISQNYFALPRGSVRENANLIILFPQNTKSVEHIYRDHCTDIPFEEFKNLCEIIWKEKHNFLTLDLSSTLFNGKYRKNLNTFYIPKSLNTTHT